MTRAVVLALVTAWAACACGVLAGFLRATRTPPPTADELDLADLLLARPIDEWDEWASTLADIDQLWETR